MKKQLLLIIPLCLSISLLFGQCPNNNGFNSALAEPSTGNTNTACCVWGGEYITVPVTSGYNYTFATCSTPGGDDTYLTIKRESDGSDLDWDDNSCSPHATTSWTANFTGTIRVLVDIGAACGSNAINHPVDVTNNGALPVEFTSWAGRQIDHSVLLEWTTASESNNSHFEILRSVPGTVYESIGRVNGAGNSNEESHYSFYDRQPNPEENIYKLRQVDFNGEQMLYNPLSVNVQLNLSLNIEQLYPVPPSDVLNMIYFSPEAGEIEINVFDQMGRRVLSQSDISNSGWGMAKLAVSTLPNGTYSVSMRKGTKVVTGKFVK